jgi:hypothetical protein
MGRAKKPILLPFFVSVATVAVATGAVVSGPLAASASSVATRDESALGLRGLRAASPGRPVLRGLRPCSARVHRPTATFPGSLGTACPRYPPGHASPRRTWSRFPPPSQRSGRPSCPVHHPSGGLDQSPRPPPMRRSCSPQ